MILPTAHRIALVEACLAGKDTPAKDVERALAEDARRALASFVQQLWHVLEPNVTLEWGWHLDLICRELERVARGETRDLVICIPPGFMKSLLASVYFPAWWWLGDPSVRFLTLSGSDAVAIRDSWKMRMVVNSPWYLRLAADQVRRGLAPAWEMTKDQNAKVNFVNTPSLGSRQCFSTGGNVMGSRGSGYIVDDPHQVTDVLGSPEQVAAALGRAHEKVDVVLPTRVNDPRTAWTITIQQRVHEDDVAGRALRNPGVRHVVLPMHAFDLGHKWRHPEDPRAPGELLDPVRMPEVEVVKLAEKLERVPGQARAQLEQEPISAKGGTFLRDWTAQRYTWDPQRPPKPYDEVVLTVDATFKKTKAGAYNSVQAWGRHGWTRRYLLDDSHERTGYVGIRQILRDMAAKWRPAAILIEVKANGEALIDDLRSELPAVIGFNPDTYGDKMARAQLSTPAWQALSVWLPEPGFAPWVGDYVNELCAFPGSLVRDRVDAMSQLFLHWRERQGYGDDRALEHAIDELLGEV